MKRKVRMKRFKIGFSLLMSFVMICGVLQYALTAKQQPVQAATDITTSNYKTWTASTLSEARDSVNKFLTPLKGSDTERPYKGNTTWQEGSLAALDKVYYAAVSPDAGISSDLARQQLIQTVHGLELYDSGSYTGRNIALNDYPDDDLVYDLAQIVNGVESVSSIRGDQVAFFTDYGGGMNGQIPGGTSTTYRYVQDVLFEYYNRIAIVNSNGYNPAGTSAFYSGYTQLTDQNTPNLPVGSVLTKDFGRTTSNFNNYNKNDVLFRQLLGMSNPTSFGSAGSNLPAYVRYMTGVFNGKPNHGAFSYEVAPRFSRPVLILISNYEFSSEAMKQDFLKSLDEFENSTDIKARTSGKPVFIQISLKRDGAANYDPMADKIFTPGRIAKGWRHLELNSANATDPSSFMNRLIALENYPLIKNDVLMGNIRGTYLWDYANSAYLPMGQLSEMLWNSTLAANQFSFVQNSFGGSFSEQVSMTDSELHFKGNGNGGISRFDLTAAKNQYAGYKMGDKLAAYNSATISVGATPSTYNASPNLFAPISDAAVELYTYSGSGSEASASSYKLKDTIVSDTYQNYGGASYSLNTSQLASKKYGTVLSQTDLKNAVKDAMGETAYNSLNFTNSNSLNAESLTVSFDASKNVYKLYAKEGPTESTITIEHWIKDGGKIATSTQADIQKTGVVGDLANITPTVISGYTYVNSDSDPLGQVKYDAASKTVKLYYTENPKTSTITIEHWISGGGKITTQPDLSKSGTSGQPANITPTAIDGYTYVNSDSDPLSSVTFGDTNKTVKLYYTENPKEGTVTIEYWDSDTNAKITSQSDLVLKGESGTDVNYTQKDITGYAFDKDRSDNVPSKFTEGSVTVRQYYSKVYTVTIEYWDSGTNSKITTEANTVITGKKDAVLNYSPKELDGYIYDSVRSDKIPATITGDATYRAYYNKAGAVTIEYWSSDTNQKIAGQSDEVLKGILDAKVTITPKEISGYKFDASRSDSLDNITYKTGSNTIRLYYTQYVNLTVMFEKISPKEELGKVVVKAKIGDTVHLENDFSDVKTKLAELENSYRLSERPTDYAAYKVPTDDATVTYLFDGTLFLSSAPSLLEFGSGHKIMQLGEYESELPTYDKPLTVTDTRATLTNWTISVKLTEDMHSRKKPSFILKDVLYYKDGSKMTPVTSGGPIDIVTSKHSARGDYDVSETEWKNKSNGFIFKLGKNQYRDIDDYDGTLEFALTEAP